MHLGWKMKTFIADYKRVHFVYKEPLMRADVPVAKKQSGHENNLSRFE